jgi:hypothetical protein
VVPTTSDVIRALNRMLTLATGYSRHLIGQQSTGDLISDTVSFCKKKIASTYFINKVVKSLIF